MKYDKQHLLDIVGEIDSEWRKNEENQSWREKNILRSLKYECLCFCVAVIKFNSRINITSMS